MAGWLRNPNQGGGDRDAYDGAQDSPPLGPSGTLNQRPVSASTPISPTVMPQPTIPDGEPIETASNAEFAPLASNTPNAETVPPAPLTPSPAMDQDIPTPSGPPASPAPDTHDTPTAVGQKPRTPSNRRPRSSSVAAN